VRLSTQGCSQELDVAQLMRDLSDSLERENDLKEQLRFSEEESKVMRKKLSDIEDENESLAMQVAYISIDPSSNPSRGVYTISWAVPKGRAWAGGS